MIPYEDSNKTIFIVSTDAPKEDVWYFPQDATILRELRERIESFMQDIPLDEKKKMRMTLCVDEAAANIIEHCIPTEGDDDFQFKMTVACDAGFFKVVFSDKGLPFDPTKAPLVDIKTHVRSGKKGGLGVHIMRLNLDIFEYQRVEDHNIFTLGMSLGLQS